MGNFTFKPIYLLDSHRPLLYSDLELGEFLKRKKKKPASNSSNNNNNKEVVITEQEAEEIIEAEIVRLLNDYKSIKKKPNDKLPIVRIKVEYTGFDIIRIQRLEARFKGEVANEG